MSEQCNNWYDQLHNLGKDHSKFILAYDQCEAQKDFTPLKKQKDQIKAGIFQLRNEIPNLNPAQRKQLEILKKRYTEEDSDNNELIAAKIEWKDIVNRLRKNPKLIDTLILMEETGGEPYPIWYDQEKDEYIFIEVSDECPAGRNKVCYSRNGQIKAEKDGKRLRGNAVDIAEAMGIELMSEDEYRKLKHIGDLDMNSRCWLKTRDSLLTTGKAKVGAFDQWEGIYIILMEDTDHCEEQYSFRGLLRVPPSST